MREIRTIWLVLAALAPFAAAGEDEARPYHPYLPGAAPEGTAAVRVVAPGPDGLRPVAGARVSFWTEDVRPVATGAALVATAETDEHGVANLIAGYGGEGHWLVTAEGHEPYHEYGGLAWLGPDDVVLRPGRRVRFRVLDPAGRPLGGARVSYVIGCRHAPAARSGVAGPDGVVALEEVDREIAYEFYLDAPGVSMGPYALEPGRVGGGGLPVLFASPGRAASGLVLDEAGRPRSGVIVRGLDSSRGPVAVTDEAGAFRLDGLGAHEVLGFFVPGTRFEERGNAIVPEFASDVPLRVTLPSGSPAAPGADEPHFLLDVHVTTLHEREEGGAPWSRSERGVPVRLVRLVDGLVVSGTTGNGLLSVGAQSGLFPALVPPGRYRVDAGGGASSFESASAPAVVPGAGPVRIRVRERPWLDLRVAGEDPPEFASVVLPDRVVPVRLTRTWRDSVPDGLETVPGEGPVFARVGGMVLPLGEVEDGKRRVEFELPAPTTVRFRIPAGGEPGAAASLDWATWGGWLPTFLDPTPRRKGACEFTTRVAGAEDLVIHVDGFLPKALSLEFPPEPGTTLDLGVLDLEPEGEETVFRILGPAGRPDIGLAAYREDTGEQVDFDPEEGLRVALGREPVPVSIFSEGRFPLRVVLGRDSPRVLRFPSGRIRISVADPAGAPLPFTAYLDAVRVVSDGTERVIDGVPDGPHIVLVGAPGRVGEVRRIATEAGGEVTVESVLAPRSR